MPARQSPPPRQGTLRRKIAAVAARLMAEEGIDDYAFAKRKAARQLGIGEGEALPTNAEIEDERQLYHKLYRDEEDDERLHEMRRAAVDAMRMLAPFTPYLTGTVLDGTAGAYSEVELEIFADSAKDVEIFMINKGVRYEHRETRRGGHEAPEAVLVFDWEDVPFKLSIFDRFAQRSARRVAGRPTERVGVDAVAAMIAEDAGESGFASQS